MILVTRRRNKYGNEPVIVNGIRFDSKLEAERYQVLAVLERHGEIRGLEVHPRYQFVVAGVKIGAYTADFRYVDRDGQTVVEDVKGVLTRDYILRKKLMKALYGIEIREIRARWYRRFC